ncbi:hypothetical protein ABGB07_28915 [Micromonosporaceae bacterium B7E4]
MAQEVTSGSLLVSLRGTTTLHLSGGFRVPILLIWDNLNTHVSRRCIP